MPTKETYVLALRSFITVRFRAKMADLFLIHFSLPSSQRKGVGSLITTDT